MKPNRRARRIEARRKKKQPQIIELDTTNQELGVANRNARMYELHSQPTKCMTPSPEPEQEEFDPFISGNRLYLAGIPDFMMKPPFSTLTYKYINQLYK